MRKLIQEYAEAEIGIITQGEDPKEMLKEDLLVFRKFLENCESLFETDPKFPKAIADLIKCVASSSQVCSYLPALEEVIHNLDEIASSATNSESSAALLVIQKMAPVVFNALGTIKSQKLPTKWIDLFHALYQVSTGTFRNSQHQLPEADSNSDCTKLDYFPHWPALYTRGTYQADKNSKVQAEVCSKDIKQNSLMPGLFTVYCEHGKPF